MHKRPPVIRIELTGNYTALAEGVVVDYEKRSRGAPICALARKLVEAGHDPDTEVHIYRNGTLCFQPIPLWRWAILMVKESDNHPSGPVLARADPSNRFISPTVKALRARARSPKRALSAISDISGTMTPETTESPPSGQHHHPGPS